MLWNHLDKFTYNVRTLGMLRVRNTYTLMFEVSTMGLQHGTSISYDQSWLHLF